MACRGCNDCECKHVDVVSKDTQKQLEDKLRIFHDLVCVVANTSCFDFPKLMAKFVYMLWCFLTDIVNLIMWLKNKVTDLEGKSSPSYKAGANITISKDNVISAKASDPYNDTEVKNRLTALENKPDRDTTYTAGNNITITGNVISATVPPPKDVDLSGYVRLSDYNQLRNEFNQLKAFNDKIIANLTASGAWQGGINGNFVPNRNIATGNINIFGGTPDGNSFIRTNSGRTENDLAGGI